MEFFVVVFFVLGGLILKSAAERSVEKTPSEDAQKAREYVEELKRRNAAARRAQQPRAGGRSAPAPIPTGGTARSKEFSKEDLRGDFAKKSRKAPRKTAIPSARKLSAETPAGLRSPYEETPHSDVDLSAVLESLRNVSGTSAGGILDAGKSADIPEKSAAQRFGLDSPDSLKRAFVASEVLGKPKSLRDDWI